MTDYTTEGQWHTADDGEKLYTKTWKPTTAPKARIVFLHGFSDHVNLFGNFFPYLASHGIEVFAPDQRGWGRSVKSPAQKGLTGPTSRVLADIASFIDRFVPKPGSDYRMDCPLFLMGHSMGGGETLHFAASPLYAHQRAHIRGFLLASPWIRLHPETAPWRITVALGRLAAKVAPRFQLYNPVDPKYLTSDTEVVAMFKSDELAHDTGTLEGFDSCLRRADDIDSGRIVLTDDCCNTASSNITASRGKAALWAGHGTEDYICDVRGTEKFMKGENCKIGDRTLRLYEGWAHRTNDQDGEKKDIFAGEVVEWVLERS